MHLDSTQWSLVAAVLLGAIVVLQWVVIWSIKRHRDPDMAIECDLPIEKLQTSLAGLSLGNLVHGNSVEVFENGAYFDALVDDIAAARRTVHFETFLWQDGVLGRRIAAALAERARAGLQVRVMLDATGSKKIGEQARRQMAT